jgi:hypothetical protein
MDHRPLFLDIDILQLLGYPVQGTVKSFEHDPKLNDPNLVKVYQASLFQQLINYNIAARIDSLYIVDINAWLPRHKHKFNQIDRYVERSTTCAANACRGKTYKKHKWTATYTHGIYCIRYWYQIRKMLENLNTLRDSAQTLQFYAVQSCLTIHDDNQISVETVLRGIKVALSCSQRTIPC